MGNSPDWVSRRSLPGLMPRYRAASFVRSSRQLEHAHQRAGDALNASSVATERTTATDMKGRGGRDVLQSLRQIAIAQRGVRMANPLDIRVLCHRNLHRRNDNNSYGTCDHHAGGGRRSDA